MAIARIREFFANGLDNATFTSPAGSTVGANFGLIFVVHHNGHAATLTDSPGNALPIYATHKNVTDNYSCFDVYKIANPLTSAAHTFTVTSFDSSPGIYGLFMSGVDAANPFDGAPAVDLTGTDSPYAIGPITPSVPGCMLALGISAWTSGLSVSGGFTTSFYSDIIASVFTGGGGASLLQTAAAPATATITAVGVDNCAALYTIRPSAGAAPGLPGAIIRGRSAAVKIHASRTRRR